MGAASGALPPTPGENFVSCRGCSVGGAIRDVGVLAVDRSADFSSSVISPSSKSAAAGPFARERPELARCPELELPLRLF